MLDLQFEVLTPQHGGHMVLYDLYDADNAFFSLLSPRTARFTAAW